MDSEAVTARDLRGQLEQVRDVLWDRLAVPGLRADALAPVAKAYMDVCVKLNDLPNDAEGSVTDGLADELAKLRAKRPTGSAPARAKKAAGS